MHVKNGDASPTTLTAQTPAKAGGMDIAEQAIVIAAGAEGIVGPFPTAYFNQTDGQVYLNWSNVTSITFAVVRV